MMMNEAAKAAAAAKRDAALSVACPACHAKAGERCINSYTGQPMRTNLVHHERVARWEASHGVQ